MKALKSDLAKTVLADPAATAKLRRYLASHRSAASADAAAQELVIELPSTEGQTLRLKPVIVPKAA